MTKETALGFYTYKSLTMVIVSNERLSCDWHEHHRHMVNNHSGMYTKYVPDYITFIKQMLATCDLDGPYAQTQNRIESGRFVFISQDLMLGLTQSARELLCEQIILSYAVAGNDTQELHNYYFSDSIQNSIDRSMIRSGAAFTFENYLYTLVKAQVKTEHPRVGFFKRKRLESDYRKRPDIARRFKTADDVRREWKTK